MNKYIWTVMNSCIACLLVNLHNIKLYNFILYKDNNPIFPAMPLNRTLHCHTTIGPLDPPIQTCAPPTRAITQSVISGPGMLWKSPTNTSEGIGIAEELVWNILSTCMTGFFYTALFIGKFCCYMWTLKFVSFISKSPPLPKKMCLFLNQNAKISSHKSNKTAYTINHFQLKKIVVIWYTNIFVRCIYESVSFTDYTHISMVHVDTI